MRGPKSSADGNIERTRKCRQNQRCWVEARDARVGCGATSYATERAAAGRAVNARAKRFRTFFASSDRRSSRVVSRSLAPCRAICTQRRSAPSKTPQTAIFQRDGPILIRRPSRALKSCSGWMTELHTSFRVRSGSRAVVEDWGEWRNSRAIAPSSFARGWPDGSRLKRRTAHFWRVKKTAKSQTTITKL